MSFNYDQRSSRERLINPSLPVPVISLAKMFVLSDITLLSWREAALVDVLLGAIWMFILIRYSSDYKRRKLLAIFMFVFLLAEYIPCSIISLNVLLDKSVGWEYRAEVIGKYSGKYNDGVRVRLPNNVEESIGVSLKFYQQVEPGDTVIVIERSGALNMPYVFIDQQSPLKD